jgi:hypothetical protein
LPAREALLGQGRQAQRLGPKCNTNQSQHDRGQKQSARRAKSVAVDERGGEQRGRQDDMRGIRKPKRQLVESRQRRSQAGKVARGVSPGTIQLR